MKLTHHFVLLALTTFLVACGPAGDASNGAGQATTSTSSAYTDLTVQEFEQRMADPNTVVIDVRTPAEIAQGKIEGALEMDIKNSDFLDMINGLDRNPTYLLYCRSGRRSATAARMMSERGFGELYNLEGGYLKWEAEHAN